MEKKKKDYRSDFNRVTTWKPLFLPMEHANNCALYIVDRAI
jgi:hypothetical protein